MELTVSNAKSFIAVMTAPLTEKIIIPLDQIEQCLQNQ